MRLYTYFRSGTSHRLRIALALKGLEAEHVFVDLRAGAQHAADFRRRNPQGLVPVLEVDDLTLVQSPAIIEWLEERHPEPPLLPPDVHGRARVRALAAVVGCDVHPLNNKRVLDHLRGTLGCDEAAVNAWCATWIEAGFDALEALLAADPDRGSFCYGAAPTVADIYLIPQVESARRFHVDLERWPVIRSIDVACAELNAFRLAAPALQPDAG